MGLSIEILIVIIVLIAAYVWGYFKGKYNAKSERLHTLQAERNELVVKMANAHFDWEIDKIIARIDIIDLQMDNLLRN